jgi:glutamate-ammonia-ligase adenylyltransferase
MIPPLSSQALARALRARFPGLRHETIQAFCDATSAEYRARYSVEQIGRHFHLTTEVDGAPLRLLVSEPWEDTYDIVIVARDYFSVFAMITGLLAAYGLDIQDASIATFTPPKPIETSRRGALKGGRRPSASGPTAPRILDVFRVRTLSPRRFASAQQEQFKAELAHVIGLLAEDRIQDARAHVNRRLTEAVTSTSGSRATLQPLDIRFDNRPTLPWTVMDIQGRDTPGFLYAFANALAMRGVAIHSAKIRTAGTVVHDRFCVTDQRGRKITSARAQASLRITAVLIKQFTHCLSAAPDPAKALAHFDQMLDQVLNRAPAARVPAFLQEQATLDLLARLFGTSDFLWEDFLRLHLDSLLPVLQDFKAEPLENPRGALMQALRRRMARARTHEARKAALNRFKDQELFRIDMTHLVDPSPTLDTFSQALTDLAEVVLAETLRVCRARLAEQFGTPRRSNGRPCGFAIYGLGKFGGCELGYASDIELLFVYEGAGHTDGSLALDNSEYHERLCQDILGFIEAKQEGIFHLDVRLRPHGGKGLLACSADEFAVYYNASGQAAPFERQALIKLRWVAGSRSLGQRVEALRDRYVYSGKPWDLSDAMEIRRRQTVELVSPGAINVKYSPGGLLDIEYAAQYLQIMQATTSPDLRTPSTLAALAALRHCQILTPAEHIQLSEDYRFLRRLIDALRIVRGHAQDLVLPPWDSEELTFLARRMGEQAPRWRMAAARLRRDIERRMRRTRKFFMSRFAEKA